MTHTVLVITDNLDARWVHHLRAAGVDGRVLPLGIDPGAFVESTPAGSWTVADLANDALEAHALVREFIPSFIYALPKQELDGDKTLFDLFEDDRVNRWWFLEIAEKSPLRGRLVNQIYFLALIRSVVTRGGFDEIWLDLEDQCLAGVVSSTLVTGVPVRQVGRRWRSWRAWVIRNPLFRYPFFAGGTWLLHLGRCIALWAIRLDRQQTVENAVVFFSFYPAWWNRAYEPDCAERMFDGLPEVVRQRTPVCYAVWLTDGPLTLWRQRVAFRRAVGRLRIIPLQAVLGVCGAGEVLSFRHVTRLVRFQFRLARGIQGTFAGFPIGKLVCDEIARSMTGGEFFMDLLMRRAFERLADRVRLRAVIYRVEFQPFEKAILAGIRGRTVGVAFQHSTIMRNYLSHFFVPGELEGYSDGDSRAMPLPYLLLTSGPQAREIMASNGFAPQRLEICGPVRYSRLLKYCRDRRSSTEIRRALRIDPLAAVFLVATSVVKAESLALLIALRQALETLPIMPYVIFKGHPAMPLDSDFHQLVGLRLQSEGYRVLPPDAQIYEYVAAADAVILSGTTVGWEAMLLGVVPIVFESRTVFAATSMNDIEQACFVVHDASELSRAMRLTIDRDARVRDIHAHWDDAVGQMFDQIDKDPNERFVQILTKHGLMS